MRFGIISKDGMEDIANEQLAGLSLDQRLRFAHRARARLDYSEKFDPPKQKLHLPLLETYVQCGLPESAPYDHPNRINLLGTTDKVSRCRILSKGVDTAKDFGKQLYIFYDGIFARTENHRYLLGYDLFLSTNGCAFSGPSDGMWNFVKSMYEKVLDKEIEELKSVSVTAQEPVNLNIIIGDTQECNLAGCVRIGDPSRMLSQSKGIEDFLRDYLGKRKDFEKEVV